MTRWLQVGAVVLIVGVGSWWFLATHERVTDTRRTGWDREARVNEFLAAERLLQHFDIESESTAALTPSNWLPDVGDTIVTHATVSIATIEERSYLLNWVAEGGHLVLLAPYDSTEELDDFMSEFGFYLFDAEPEDEEVAELPDAADYDIDISFTAERIDYDDWGDEFDVSATLSDDYGALVARRAWENGYVTLTTTNYHFNNYNIEEDDNGRLFMDLVAGFVDPGKVWFIYAAEFPSLWAVIWRSVPYLIVALVVLFLLWLWSVIPKFGPDAAPEVTTRRSIGEHIRAAGLFVWRHRGASVLTDASADALMHDAERKHPGIGRLSREKQAQVIARISGITSQQALDMLVNSDTSQPREFVHTMQSIQNTRKKI